MNMYAVSFTADGFKTLIITAADAAQAKRAVAATFPSAIFLGVKSVGGK